MESKIKQFDNQMCAYLLPFIFVCLCASGCTTLSPNISSKQNELAPQANDAPESLIATDLVSALMQLPDFSPWSSTFQITAPTSTFGQSIESALRVSGYGVQRVSADQGNYYVSYSNSKILSNVGTTQRFSLTIGRVSIERDFEINSSSVYPTSLVKITGVQPTNVVVNDDLFRQLGGNHYFPSGVVFQSLDGRTLTENKKRVGVTDKSIPPYGEQISHQRFLIMARARLFLKSKLSTKIDVRDWEPVSQVLLVFPSRDNRFLGARNKNAIKKMLHVFDPEINGFSVTGCKGNASLLWDGTEGESLDRQQRVRQELLAAGVDISRVRENGCFAGEFDHLLKKQSVLLTLRER